jgi:hypothetical protein
MKMSKPITKGTKFAEVMMKLDVHERMEIAKVMARASEKSYRRGFQQGAHIGGDQGELHDWRYFNSLDVAVWRECGTKASALHHLMMENPDLHKSGINDA